MDGKHGWAKLSYGLEPGEQHLRYGLTDKDGLFRDQDMKVTPMGVQLDPGNVNPCVVKRCPKKQASCLDMILRVDETAHVI